MQYQVNNTIDMCLVRQKNLVSLVGICVLYRRDPPCSPLKLTESTPNLKARGELTLDERSIEPLPNIAIDKGWSGLGRDMQFGNDTCRLLT
jgi:hypothetical protein